MVLEAQLFDNETERFYFDRAIIDKVALPLGDRYPDEIMSNYFAQYGGMVQKYRPRRILEIGVRYGYTAIVLCTAALYTAVRSGKTDCDVEYLGIDDESYHANSCAQANENFRIAIPWANARCLRWNSFDGLPPSCNSFDMIAIDGNHDQHGVFNDLQICWPALNPGGVILLDDYQMPQIVRAIDNWLALYDTGEEIIEVQEVQNERGMFLLRKVPSAEE